MRRRTYLFVFVLTLGEALLFSINSPFIAGLIGEGLVGAVYSLASIAALVILALLPAILSRSRPSSILESLMLIAAATAIGTALSPGVALLGFLVIFLAVPQVTPALVDLYIEKESHNSDRGRAIGAEFTFMNMAFVIAPVIAGLVIARSGFDTLYVVAGIIFLLALAISRSFTRKVNISNTHRHGSFLIGIKHAWRRKDVRVVLILAFLLQFFFSWMVIYTPIYLQFSFGFSFETLGLIFSIMLLPYILLEYPLGKLADNSLGEKELLTSGFALMALTVFAIPFITSGSVWVWAVILFGTRVGAAMVEGMSATYFYKKAQVEEVDLIALFRDQRPVAYLIGPILASLILSRGSMPTLFIILAVIMAMGAILATRLHDTR